MLSYNISNIMYNDIVTCISNNNDLDSIIERVSKSLVINEEDAFNIIALCGLRQFGAVNNKLKIFSEEGE